MQKSHYNLHNSSNIVHFKDTAREEFIKLQYV